MESCPFTKNYPLQPKRADQQEPMYVCEVQYFTYLELRVQCHHRISNAQMSSVDYQSCKSLSVPIWDRRPFSLLFLIIAYMECTYNISFLISIHESLSNLDLGILCILGRMPCRASNIWLFFHNLLLNENTAQLQKQERQSPLVAVIYWLVFKLSDTFFFITVEIQQYNK